MKRDEFNAMLSQGQREQLERVKQEMLGGRELADVQILNTREPKPDLRQLELPLEY